MESERRRTNEKKRERSLIVLLVQPKRVARNGGRYKSVDF